eukprot:2141620-Prymnesium_polylepis.1
MGPLRPLPRPGQPVQARHPHRTVLQRTRRPVQRAARALAARAQATRPHAPIDPAAEAPGGRRPARPVRPDGARPGGPHALHAGDFGDFGVARRLRCAPDAAMPHGSLAVMGAHDTTALQ